MQTKKLLILSVALAAGVAAAGHAHAQGPHRGGMQPEHHGPGMHAMMHGQMPMHGDMHERMPMRGDMHRQAQRGPTGPGHAPHGGPAVAGDQSPSSLAFGAVNDKMHREMRIAFSGDADLDFVHGMIPHHQGAVDMAKIVLAFGKDPELRKLAEAIVKAQEDEIAFMQAWLVKRGQKSQ
jgi:uncharacterized protein (DUF305 family)